MLSISTSRISDVWLLLFPGKVTRKIFASHKAGITYTQLQLQICVYSAIPLDEPCNTHYWQKDKQSK